jgi:hypothetical protein
MNDNKKERCQILHNRVLYTSGETTIEFELPKFLGIPFQRMNSASDYAWQFEDVPNKEYEPIPPGCAGGEV